MGNVWLDTGWLIPLYPLLGALLSVPWSPAFIKKTGPRPAGYINLLTTFVGFIHSLLALQAIWGQPPLHWQFTWFEVASLTIQVPFTLSALSLGAAMVIMGLNMLVQVYSIGYMEMDWGWARFYGLLALFEGGMTLLVFNDSLFFSYLLLEILTLGTYLLVGFWFNQSLVVTGARDAFLTKRVGDLVLLMAVIALYPLAGTWNYDELGVWARTAEISPLTATLLGVALVAGPMGKCAQFPLQLWLDEAMEGPLPSTILRNSVVVSVGAWVLIRLTPVVALSDIAQGLAIVAGSITAVGGALIAVAQVDAKRVLSYLSSSFLGIVFIAVGAQQVAAAYFLLLTFAIAMATLVASTGSVILTCVTQDLTQVGGLWSRRPVTGLCFLVGTVSLIGLPPLGSFWSLRTLLDGLWQAGDIALVAVILVTNLVAGFSLMRMFGLMFLGPMKAMSTRAPEPIWLVVMPMAIFAALALHTPMMLKALALLPIAMISDTGLLLLGSSVIGCGAGLMVYGLGSIKNPQGLLPRWLVDLLAYDFYTSTVYKNTVVLAVGTLATVSDWLDRYVIDGFVNLVGLASVVGGETLKYNNTGRSQFYMLTIALFVVVLGILMSWVALPSPLMSVGQLLGQPVS
ncbi:MAG: NAD(P)H-quinone oxidoreductase subunit F [Cyanobacteria bacterium P01_A01_bin.105]